MKLKSNARSQREYPYIMPILKKKVARDNRTTAAFSLLEVLMVLALSAIAMLGIMAMLQVSTKANRGMGQQFQFTNLGNLVAQSVGDPTRCLSMLNNAFPTPVPAPTPTPRPHHTPPPTPPPPVGIPVPATVPAITIGNPDLQGELTAQQIAITTGASTLVLAQVGTAQEPFVITSITLSQATRGNPNPSNLVPYILNLEVDATKTVPIRAPSGGVTPITSLGSPAMTVTIPLSVTIEETASGAVFKSCAASPGGNMSQAQICQIMGGHYTPPTVGPPVVSGKCTGSITDMNATEICTTLGGTMSLGKCVNSIISAPVYSCYCPGPDIIITAPTNLDGQSCFFAGFTGDHGDMLWHCH